MHPKSKNKLGEGFGDLVWGLGCGFGVWVLESRTFFSWEFPIYLIEALYTLNSPPVVSFNPKGPYTQRVKKTFGLQAVPKKGILRPLYIPFEIYGPFDEA